MKPDISTLLKPDILTLQRHCAAKLMLDLGEYLEDDALICKGTSARHVCSPSNPRRHPQDQGLLPLGGFSGGTARRFLVSVQFVVCAGSGLFLFRAEMDSQRKPCEKGREPK